MKYTHRTMYPSDVVEGNKFIVVGDDGLYKGVIKNVLNPNSQYKAFNADDGCRYGLEDCYIKLEKG